MFKYRNVRTGRVIERPTRDEWLEASDGWTWDEVPEPEAPAEDDNERTDD